jgi:hypothetical protein
MKGAGAVGLTLTARAGRARGQSASVVLIRENGTVSTNGISGAATWIAPTTAVASSLETGDIIQVTAWGGSEFGYAYTYALSGAPAGVAIDRDMGRIRVATALAVGAHTFSVIVTNRENTSLVASFPFTLNVLQGITTGTPTASQIRHATFDPASGTWGKPTGNNWTAVFNAMQTAILSLQATCNAVRDESLRVDIPLRRGTTYQYTKNNWLDGIQYCDVHATGAGAKPIMQCTSTIRSPYNAGPINLGGAGGGNIGPGAIGHQIDGIKSKCALIATVAAGSTTLTLLSSGDASKIKVGRWHQVVGSVIQIGGYPPNCQYIDYVKVTNVSGTTVTLGRPLKYGYDQTWYENPRDDTSLGMARLCPYDTGGTGGYIPTDRRIMIRSRITNVTFADNPNQTARSLNASLQQIQGAIDWTYENCDLRQPVVSEGKHFQFIGCTKAYPSEWDKLIETILMDSGDDSTQGCTGATGVQYLLIRNHHMGSLSLSPRQLRGINSNFDGSIVSAYGCPVTMQYQGPLMYWDFGSAGACQFTHCGTSGRWTWAFNNTNDAARLVVGRNANWSGNQLRIPSTYSNGGTANFETWLSWSFPGAIVSTNSAPPFSTNWGYVQSATSPMDGSAVWLNIVWVNGTKPTSGMTIYMFRRRRLFFASGNTLNSSTTWVSPGFFKETATGHESGWNFPVGNPPAFSG